MAQYTNMYALYNAASSDPAYINSARNEVFMSILYCKTL